MGYQEASGREKLGGRVVEGGAGGQEYLAGCKGPERMCRNRVSWEGLGATGLGGMLTQAMINTKHSVGGWTEASSQRIQALPVDKKGQSLGCFSLASGAGPEGCLFPILKDRAPPRPPAAAAAPSAPKTASGQPAA